MSIRAALSVAAVALCLLGCSASSDLRRATGITLCPSADVQDLTARLERDTTPGFSYHLLLSLDPSCVGDFERQLSAISPKECPVERLWTNGCFVVDAYAVAGKHTSIIAKPISRGKYDVRFYQ